MKNTLTLSQKMMSAGLAAVLALGSAIPMLAPQPAMADTVAKTTVKIDLSGYNAHTVFRPIKTISGVDLTPLVTAEDGLSFLQIPYGEIASNATHIGGDLHENGHFELPNHPVTGSEPIGCHVIMKDTRGDGVHDHVHLFPLYAEDLFGFPDHVTDNAGTPDDDSDDYTVPVGKVIGDDGKPVPPDAKLHPKAPITNGSMDDHGNITYDPKPGEPVPDYVILDAKDNNGDGIYDEVTVIPHFPPEFELVTGEKVPDDQLEWEDPDGKPVPDDQRKLDPDVKVDGGHIGPDGLIIVDNDPTKPCIGVKVEVVERDPDTGLITQIKVIPIYEGDDQPTTPDQPVIPGDGNDHGQGNGAGTTNGGKQPLHGPGLAQMGDNVFQYIYGLLAGAMGSLILLIIAAKRRRDEDEQDGAVRA